MAFTPAGRLQRKRERSPTPLAPRSGTSAHVPPQRRGRTPISIPLRDNLRERNGIPPPYAGTGVVPSSHPEGANPLAPRVPRYLSAARRGPAALRLPWPGSGTKVTVPAHVLSIPGWSVATLWGAERSPPHTGARAPRRRSLLLAACPGFLPHEQTLEKLVRSSRTTARASDKPRWLPAIPWRRGSLLWVPPGHQSPGTGWARGC